MRFEYNIDKVLFGDYWYVSNFLMLCISTYVIVVWKHHTAIIISIITFIVKSLCVTRFDHYYMQYWPVTIRKYLWYVVHLTLLVLHVLIDNTIISTYMDPVIMPLRLHTSTHMSKRNDGSIDVIIVLWFIGTCWG